jgi:hypothetical protein
MATPHERAPLAAAPEVGNHGRRRTARAMTAALGGTSMQLRGSVGAAIVAALLSLPCQVFLPCQAWAFDDTLYPDLTGQWVRADASPSFDPAKPPGRGQQAPLTAEYLAKFDAIVADRVKRQLTDVLSTSCIAPGMPMLMQAYEPMQITVLPETTYILIDHIHETHRRIFTDGRSWPKEVEPTFTGYTIGKWIDSDGDGRFDVLEAETRHFKGPRFFDGSGIPLHEDNETVIRERISLDKSDRNLLHDEITVTDHALTQPWSVTKSYRRNPDPLVDWPEFICNERLPYIRLGDEDYRLAEDGQLAPTRPGQPPPDLRYFAPDKK